MHIVACLKLVPEEQDIAIKGDRSLSFERAEPKISLYDLNAIEAAAQLAATGEGHTVTALSAGGKRLENSKARKDMLSRGPDSLTLVMGDRLENATPALTAKALAGALRSMDFGLVLCGEGSGDLYAQQTGLLLGEELGIPAINCVQSLTLEDNSVVVERVLEQEVEVLRIALPAVLMLTTDGNLPRIPGMKAILAAGKKPVTVLSEAEVLGDATAPSRVLSALAPEKAARARVIIEGDSDDNIAAFADHLRKLLQ